MITPWTQCSMCEDFICNVHGGHVYDCTCPGIDTWAEYDLFPYGPLTQAEIDRVLQESRNAEEN